VNTQVPDSVEDEAGVSGSEERRLAFDVFDEEEEVSDDVGDCAPSALHFYNV
jgi:hypothetical protein